MPQFRNRITRSPQGIEFFYCNYCKCSYKASKTEVERHLKTKKHTDITASYDQKKIFLFDSGFSQEISLEQKCKRNEIKIANFIAENNLSFNIAGDLTKLFQSMHLDEEVIEKMNCVRVKCRSTIHNVSG